MDLNPIVLDAAYRASKGQAGQDGLLTPQSFDGYLKNRMLKNGFVMTGLEFQIMNEQMREMRLLAQALLDEIEMEMKPLESTGSEQSGGSQGR
jgi:hypothetical protein